MQDTSEWFCYKSPNYKKPKLQKTLTTKNNLKTEGPNYKRPKKSKMTKRYTRLTDLQTDLVQSRVFLLEHKFLLPQIYF